MQIGESDLLNGLFQESRFNGWVVGEIHVLDERILPNGRRDHFEQSVHFNDMVNQLAPIANDLSRRCRTSSIQRNWLRQFDLAKSGIDQAMAIVQQGAVPQSRRKYIEGEIDHGLDHLKKICSNRVFDAFQKSALTKKLERLEAKVEKIFAERQEHKSLISLPTRDRKTYEYLFSLIYECSTTQTAAKALVDQLLKRIGEGRPKKGSLPHRPRST
jgi:molecular chaperone HtpG